MRRSEPLKKATKTEYSYPARVLLSSFPVAVVILPMLWLTGYPPEEWPFVCGVFALILLGSGTMIGCAARQSAAFITTHSWSPPSEG